MTNYEIQIRKWAKEGKSYKEIAALTGKSVPSIWKYFKHHLIEYKCSNKKST